jgi:hypothetical protein
LLGLFAALGLLSAGTPGTALAAPEYRCNVPIAMSDGVVLRADVFLPAPGGRFPTALTVTGYNKDATTSPVAGCAPGAGGGAEDPNMVTDGYAVVVLDDRGTGASGGQWDSWGARTQQDYQEVLDWIQHQPWSNGSVGDYGASYMAITALLVAEADAQRVAEGKPRAVKSVLTVAPMADAYRDVTFHGGAVDAGFIPLWLGLTTSDSDSPPSTLVSDPASALNTYPGHLANTFAVQTLLSASTGGDSAYDGPFYRLRSPITRIASLRIPVMWQGGWWDIFQRGEPVLYEKLTGSPDKVWFQTPNYHSSTDPTIWSQMGIGTEERVGLNWFDHWLKGENNGIQNLPQVNLYTMGANRWEHPSTWPLPNARYTHYYLGAGKSGSSNSLNDGTISTTKQMAPGGDIEPLLPASSPCSRLTAQWTAGIASSSCDTDNSTYEASSLTYTTPPLKSDTEVTGPILGHIWAELNGATDATMIAVLSDVNPQGQSTQMTAGYLLASQRAVSPKLSTYAHGVMIRPWHPFTQASQQPVTPNDPQLYQIEIYPTSNVFKAGDRIRLTIATANTPGTATPVPHLLNEVGGQLRVLRGPTYDSNVQLPVIPTR